MMAKRRSWFSYIKSLLSTDSKSKQEKEEKKRRKKKVWFFGRIRSQRSPALPAPSPPPSSKMEVEEAQNKRALAVAVATAAAAEAAVAAAQAAAQVIRLTSTPLSCHDPQEVAAIRIQTSFRGYLARRALRALRALVKLQAIARGRAVRRQTNITLRSLQSLIKIQNQARENRMRISREVGTTETREELWRKASELGEKAYQIFEEQNGKIWDDSPLSKEAIKEKFISRQEAALKRERALRYASSNQAGKRRHSLPVAKDTNNPDRRWSWLEQWVDTQTWDKDDTHEVHPVPSPRGIRPPQLPPQPPPPPHEDRTLNPTSDLETMQQIMQERELRPMARRSFNRSRRGYIRDDESFSSSPAFPSYMAFTESAKAKSRSISTPKQRVGTKDIFPDYCTVQGSKISPFPSICSDATLLKSSKLPQRTPRLPWCPS